MSNSYAHTVVQPSIPITEMTDLEWLVLKHAFEWEQNGEPPVMKAYFFSYEGPRYSLSIPREELADALLSSRDKLSCLPTIVDPIINNTDDEFIELEELDYLEVFQNIVQRSQSLKYITIEEAFTCDKMRPYEIGGAATLITANWVHTQSTFSLLESWIEEEKLNES